MKKRSHEEEEDIDLENEGDHLPSRSFAKTKRANKFITMKVPHSNSRYYHRNNELSRGSHSIVYKLLSEDESKIFAGKRLITNGSKALKLKVIDELQIYKVISRQRHPNIIQMNEFFQLPNNHLYMVLDYANNGTLQYILQYKGKLSELETKALTVQICGGIHWLHSNNIIHGDLKLGNILIDHVTDSNNGDKGYDLVKICDFGHSFINDGRKNYIDHESDIIGTPYYLAPEIIYRYRGINTSGKTIPLISFPIDIWAIGVIIFTMLYGCNPFITNADELHSLSMNDLMSRITSNIIKLPSSIANELSLLGKDLLIKLLRQNPLKRIILPEIISHEWFHTGFVKNVDLLGPDSERVSERVSMNPNREYITDEYLDALKAYGFGKLLFRSKKHHKKDIALLDILKSNVRKARRSQAYLCWSEYIYVDPIMESNKLLPTISKQIVVDEIQSTLRNIYETKFYRKESNLHVSNSSPSFPVLITRRKILRSETSNGESSPETTFFYQLTNGQFGCLLDGGHSMLLNDTKTSFWYIIPDQRSGWISKCFPQDVGGDKVPSELMGRLQYINDCKLDMELSNIGTETSQDQIWLSIDGLRHEGLHGDVYLRKYIMFGEATNHKINVELYILSDGTYQFNFKQEGITIILHQMGQYLSILDYQGNAFTCKYFDLLWGDNNSANQTDATIKGMLLDKVPIIEETLKLIMTTI